MDEKKDLEPIIPLTPPVNDHLMPDQEVVCGYCGYAFSGNESRIEKTIYGQKWVFCSEECLNDFRDASDHVDSDQDPDKVRVGSFEDDEPSNL